MIAPTDAQAEETAYGQSGEAGHIGGDQPAEVVSLEQAQADVAATGQADKSDH